MFNREERVATAKNLYDAMNTVWDEYDFSETSIMYERRVPNMKFSVPVKVMNNEVHRFVDKSNRYVREMQFEYDGNVYIFALSTWLDCDNKPMRYSLDIFVPAGDGKGGYVKVFDVYSL